MTIRLNTWLVQRLNLDFPLILAPLAGGPCTPSLVSEVCNAGCLGFLGAAYLAPTDIENELIRIKKLTKRPFGVNLFVPVKEPHINDDDLQKALLATNDVRRLLGLNDPVIKPPYQEDFDQQFAVILKHKPAVFSFTFGSLDTYHIQECRKQGILTFGTATTLVEGLELQASGVDAVIAQGYEAGGHRGLFHVDQFDSQLSMFVLTRLLSTQLNIPVIATGGIMDGRGILASLMLGAVAAQLGTAFLACPESGCSKPYLNALLSPGDKKTRLTKAFSGRWARGLENEFMLKMELSAAILPFPIQNKLTKDIRTKAAHLNRSEFLSLWAGQGVHQIRKLPANQLIQQLRKEAQMALEELRR